MAFLSSSPPSVPAHTGQKAESSEETTRSETTVPHPPMRCCCSVAQSFWFFATPWTAARQASLSFTISRSLIRLMSIESVMPSNHLILFCPRLLLPSIFPSTRVFSNGSALCIRWPKYWSFTLASVLPMNIQDWFPLGLTGWFPCCPRDSQESSPTAQFKAPNSSSLSLLYGPTLKSIHDNWKNHSFD